MLFEQLLYISQYCIILMVLRAVDLMIFGVLMPLSTIFHLYHGDVFSGGGSWSTRREPPTMGKQLVNFITCKQYC